MSAQQNISPQDYELLSAYIDGELLDIERKTLEQRLSNEPILQSELSSLRATVNLINQLPTMTAPRNFTLTENMIRSPKIIPMRPGRASHTPYLSLVASITLMIFGVIFMLSEIAPSPSNFEPIGGSIQQSEQSPDILGEVAILSTEIPAETDIEVDRARIEPSNSIEAIEEESVEEEPADDGIDNLQAPSANSVASDTSATTETLSEVASDGDLDNSPDTGLDKVNGNDGALASESQVLDTESDDFEGNTGLFDAELGESDGFTDDAQFFEADESESLPPQDPQVMAGASFSEPVTSDANLIDGEVDDAVAESNIIAPQVVEGSGEAPAETTLDIAEDNAEDTIAQERRDIATATNQAIPPPAPTREIADNAPSNNLPIGVGLLGIGVLLLIASLMMIRRNRS